MMFCFLGHAVGSPCPTLVMDVTELPRDDDGLLTAIRRARRALRRRGLAEVLKFALIRPSDHPLFDLDYRFVQCLPGDGGDDFDTRGSCGHSILVSVQAASRFGWVRDLTPGRRIRVRVVGHHEHVVCELDGVNRTGHEFTSHFVYSPELRLGGGLPTGSVRDELEGPDGPIPVTLATFSNPYVFVPAHRLGIHDEETLFGEDEGLYGTLQDLRAQGARRLGLAPRGSFPKIACVGAFHPGSLSLRAISVPRWHPSVALTGAACVAATSVVRGSVPHELARTTGGQPGRLRLRTAGGAAEVGVSATGVTPDDLLRWISIAGRTVRSLGGVRLPELEGLRRSAVDDEENATWLPLNV
ncbi:PrpF domain-containing protein [Nonomuraea sp. NPDC050691]|uniref:PrpF domain-containing protein n=1 Tax=Nonomuraea sp. NPDC050691 TaxID=3155661 RepID=UPI0033C41ECF